MKTLRDLLPNDAFGRTHTNELEDNISAALFNYFVYGICPGSFTKALLSDSLYNTIAHAHPAILPHIAVHVRWIINYAPRESYGSYQIVEDWINDKNGVRTKYVKEVEKRYIWKTLKG